MSSNFNIQKSKKSVVLDIFHNAYTAWIILFLSLTLTIFAWYFANKLSQEKALDRFELRTNEISNAIQERMTIYEQVLRSGVGFMQSSNKVTRDDFKNFVKVIDIEKNWPGIQGIGYSIPVSPSEKKAHEQLIREEGFEDYEIRPKGKREEYSSIIYLEPFDWRNKRAFGYDMWSNEMRRDAMMRARDGGLAATSGMITLVQETENDVQKGFLTYVPLYKKNFPVSTVEERRKAFSGWVYAAFRVGDLMKGIIGSKDSSLDFEIFDGEEISKGNLLFDSDNEENRSKAKYDGMNLDEVYSMTEGRLVRIVSLNLQGRTWKIIYNTNKETIHSGFSYIPNLIAIAGFIIDILLFYVIYSIYYLQKRANGMAEEMTLKIKEDSMILKEQAEQLELKNQELEQFAYRTSHDLRSPISTMKGILNLIVNFNEPKDADANKELLGRLGSNLERMDKMTGDILNLSKATFGEEQISKIDFEEVVNSIKLGIEEKLNENVIEINLENNLNKDFYSQSTRINQILDNIITNGVKYCDKDKATRYVKVSIEENNQDGIKIRISDNGLGIPEKDKNNIFDMFYRANVTKEVGSGLGLYIVKRHIEKLEGKIEVESIEGEGTEFKITLRRK